jgi:hypothetical protein
MSNTKIFLNNFLRNIKIIFGHGNKTFPKKIHVEVTRNCVCRHFSLRYSLVDQRHILVLQCFKSLLCSACLAHDPAKSAKGYLWYSVARRRPTSVRFLLSSFNVSGIIRLHNANVPFVTFYCL